MDSINLKGVGFHLGPKNLRGSRGARENKKVSWSQRQNLRAGASCDERKHAWCFSGPDPDIEYGWTPFLS